MVKQNKGEQILHSSFFFQQVFHQLEQHWRQQENGQGLMMSKSYQQMHLVT